ncbi:hypothetical protein F5148DRAFT_979523 [Russula earlei]|uniref:Uncharacterized protein n=1 Tax=Russula earlei TaxID=71964 RepID=A0ACC0UAF4_9AGAM|nr:hypothetical protein F5148DRAFT_979523 [Russula earlei]
MVKGSKSDKETTYEFRDIVLAKVRGYPPWPGMVVDPQNVSKEVLRERPQNKKSSFYCVRFFPKGDHAWLVSKDISRLKPHEIEAFINEPSKRSGELLDGYKVALDPAKWEEDQELKRANAEEEEANAEVDQLDGETDGLDADGDADADELPSKSKKRKRESETKPKVRTKASVKKDKDADSVKRKAAGKRNGARSKALVESEDDGAAEADGDDDDDAGPSKRAASPPAAKKPKKDDDPLASDPEAVRVRDWRHKLQKTFLNDKGTGPKPDEMPACNDLFAAIEQYDKMNIHYLSYSKIGKVMRHIHLQPSDKIPRDDQFHFRSRAKALVDKWHVILSANKEAGPGTNDTPAESSPTAPSKADKIEEDVPNGAAAVSTVEVLPAADGTTSVDVTMAEA